MLYALACIWLSYKKRQGREICVKFKFYAILEGAAHRNIK